MPHTSRRRTPSDLPGLDIAEQKSWQNFLHAALRFHTTMDRWLTEAHQLSVIDLRVLDILDKSDDGAARMGDLADALGANPHHMTSGSGDSKSGVWFSANRIPMTGVGWSLGSAMTAGGWPVMPVSTMPKGSRPTSSARCRGASSPPLRRIADGSIPA